MRIDDITANTRIVEIWPEEHLWMRPPSNALLKRISRQANLMGSLERKASEARSRAESVEGRVRNRAHLDEVEAIGRKNVSNRSGDELAALRAVAERTQREAADIEAAADKAAAEFGRMVFEEVVVDSAGELLEGDPSTASGVLLAQIFARIQETHERLGKNSPSATD